ncbi:hypothetical protein QMP26_21375 [Enterocloster clostridioformis]|uniref:hypothetical protein n=1 Tax=Enterocloster clostridioformis TaxID=1531 RepID=UPI0026756287|nr:hypothetical protein [Enterocloster clostridioformis]
MPKETVKILKARYEEREIVSFDHLRLHGYLCVQSEPNRKWAVLVHEYDDSGLWFGREALAFYQAGFTFFCRMREVMKKPGRISTVETETQ